MRTTRRRPVPLLSALAALTGCDDPTGNSILTTLIMGLISVGAVACDACVACWNFGAETAPYLSDGGSMTCEEGRLEGFLREADAKRRPVAHLDGRRVGSFAVESDRRATLPCEVGRVYVVRFER